MKLIQKLAAHPLTTLSIIFMILIPLYPKLPAIRLNDTYISIRLEDFYVVLMLLVFAILYKFHNYRLPKQYVKLFVYFWLSVLASWAFGVVFGYITQPKLGLMHAARRFEYMAPFFVSYLAITSECKDYISKKGLAETIYKFFNIVSIVFILVAMYGVAQKFAAIFTPIYKYFEVIYVQNADNLLGDIAYRLFVFFQFPAIQTMNSEFAKGGLLHLTPDSRISSTFAGHYDLAAYIVFLLPMFAAFIYQNKHKVRSTIAYVFGIFALVLTSSRISFGAFVTSMAIFFIAKRNYKGLLLTAALTGLFMYSNGDLTKRFKEMIQRKTVFENTTTGEQIINENKNPAVLPAGGTVFRTISQSKPVKTADRNTIDALRRELILKELEEAKKSGKEITEAEAAAIVKDKYKQFQDVFVKEVLAGDTSMATRLQVEWPRAIMAFVKNPLLGTGPFSITESTDGDYFRWLGETGLLGTAIFALILYNIAKSSVVASQQAKSKHIDYIYWGFFCGLVALFVNALLIDVFEASKVAFTFWIISGFMMGALELSQRHHEPSEHKAT